MKVPKLCRNSDGRAFAIIPKSGGKRKWLGRYGTPDADKKYRQWVAQLLTGIPLVVSHAPTMLSLAALYLDHARTYYCKNGQPTKEYGLVSDAIGQLLELHADTLASDFGPPQLIQVQTHMLGRYSRKTVNNHISRCKRMVRWCCAMGHADANWYHQLTTVDGIRKGRADVKESQPVRPVEWATVKATLPFIAPPVRAMVQLQYYCGMRPQDVTNMRAADIDTSGRVWLYTPATHKTEHHGQSLVKAIPQIAQPLLQPFLSKPAFLFTPADSHAWHAEQRRQRRQRKTPLYPSEAKRRKNKPSRRLGRKYTTDSYRRAIGHGIAAAKKVGVIIPHWHPNQLRHAVATEIAQTLGQQAAQRWLGHARLDTTSIYAEKQLSELVAIAERLDEHWG